MSAPASVLKLLNNLKRATKLQSEGELYEAWFPMFTKFFVLDSRKLKTFVILRRSGACQFKLFEILCKESVNDIETFFGTHVGTTSTATTATDGSLFLAQNTPSTDFPPFVIIDLSWPVTVLKKQVSLKQQPLSSSTCVIDNFSRWTERLNFLLEVNETVGIHNGHPAGDADWFKMFRNLHTKLDAPGDRPSRDVLRTYVCVICEGRFAYAKSLRTHKLRRHGIKHSCKTEAETEKPETMVSESCSSSDSTESANPLEFVMPKPSTNEEFVDPMLELIDSYFNSFDPVMHSNIPGILKSFQPIEPNEEQDPNELDQDDDPYDTDDHFVKLTQKCEERTREIRAKRLAESTQSQATYASTSCSIPVIKPDGSGVLLTSPGQVLPIRVTLQKRPTQPGTTGPVTAIIPNKVSGSRLVIRLSSQAVRPTATTSGPAPVLRAISGGTSATASLANAEHNLHKISDLKQLLEERRAQHLEAMQRLLIELLVDELIAQVEMQLNTVQESLELNDAEKIVENRIIELLADPEPDARLLRKQTLKTSMFDSASSCMPVKRPRLALSVQPTVFDQKKLANYCSTIAQNLNKTFSKTHSLLAN